jgi:hypothetical protein
MQAIRKINPLARAIAVIGSVMVLATGATYAAFVDSVTLTGNNVTVASANADLLIWNAQANEFQDSAPGFAFTDLEPGEESEKKNFYFKNDGNIPLYLTVSIPEDDTDFNGINPADVTFKFYGECTDTPVTATMAALQAGEIDLPCDPLEEDAQGVIGQEGNEANYAVTATLADSVELDDDDLDPAADDFTFLFNGYSQDADTGGDDDTAVED